MSGRNSDREAAQLAVMDALVFFAVAILISSIVLSYSQQPVNDRTPEDSISVALLLDVVMSCSVGCNLTVGGEPPTYISRQAPVRDCIAVEGEHLFRGGDPAEFADLNSVILEVLDKCMPPMQEPHLLLVFKSYSEPLLALPHHTLDEDSRKASSVTLTLEGGSQLLVVLVLCPAALPESVQA